MYLLPIRSKNNKNIIDKKKIKKMVGLHQKFIIGFSHVLFCS